MEPATSLGIKAALLAALLCALPLTAVADEEARDAWLKEAQLGPYLPESEDWDAVAALAAEEPPLLVFMSTSRVERILELFSEKYPEVEVEGLYSRQPELIERVTREFQAGLSDVGIIEFADASTVSLLPEGSLVTYIPQEVAHLYPEDYKEPFQYASYYYGWGYNPLVSPDGVPFESIWDLTTEEFRGKLILEDPVRSLDTHKYLTNIVARPDEVAADYEATFGEPLEISEADAGFEWLRRLLENEPTVVSAWREAADILHENPEKMMVSGLNFARMSNVQDGTYNMAFATSITPVETIEITRWAAINAFSKSPNAAKLFIRELIDGPVAAPILEHGFSSPKQGWDTSVDWMQPMLSMTSWPIDVDYMIQRGHEVVDFWLLYGPESR